MSTLLLVLSLCQQCLPWSPFLLSLIILLSLQLTFLICHVFVVLTLCLCFSLSKQAQLNNLFYSFVQIIPPLSLCKLCLLLELIQKPPTFSVRRSLYLCSIASLSLFPLTDEILLPPHLSYFLWTFYHVAQAHSHMAAIPTFSCSFFKILICNPPPLPFCCLKGLIFSPLVGKHSYLGEHVLKKNLVPHLPWLWKSSATKSVCMGPKTIMTICNATSFIFFCLLALHSSFLLLFGHPLSAFIIQLTSPGTPVNQKLPRLLFLRKQVQTRVKELVGSWHVRVTHVWEAVTIYAFLIEFKFTPTEFYGRTFTDSNNTDTSLESTENVSVCIVVKM